MNVHRIVKINDCVNCVVGVQHCVCINNDGQLFIVQIREITQFKC